MIFVLIATCVAISAWLICLLLSNPSSIFYVLDDPTDRSLHDVPKPRTGGIAIFISIFITWLIIVLTQDVEIYIYYVLMGLCLLSVISLIDDRYSIPQIWRLLVHILAAILLILSGIGLSANDIQIENLIDNSMVLNVLTILVVVWCINLYNFMDGMDGLAGGMGVIGFGCLAWLGWLAGNNLFMFMALIIAAANLGFLLHNFPPAKIFMGDVGSITMGYLVAFFSLWGIKAQIFTWWIPILIFSPFIVDATITLIKRLYNREKVWEAHKSHYYQKLVQIGWGHRKTAIYEYILMATIACSVIAIQVLNSDILTIILTLLWLLIYIVIIFIVSRLATNSGNLP